MLKQQLTAAIIFSILGIACGILLFYTSVEVIAIVIGIYFILCGLPGLFLFRFEPTEREQNVTLISSIVLIAAGILSIAYKNIVAYIIAGCMLLVFPIYRIIISPKKMEAFKKEALKLFLGVMLIIFGVGTVVEIVCKVLGALVILFSLIYLVYSIILLIKLNKIQKQEEKDNEVIDV